MSDSPSITPADRRRLEEIQKTTETMGWKYLVENIQSDIETLNNLMATEDLDDMNRRKGAIHAMSGLANYGNTVKQLLDQADSPDWDQDRDQE